MIKKLVSKALLPLVLDKKARGKLEPAAEPAKAPKPAAPKKRTRPDNPAGTSKSTAAARRMAASIADLPGPDPIPDNLSRAETEALIKESLAEAERQVERRIITGPSRADLIRQAVAVQRSKTGVFDELSKEQREKLYVVAMKTLNLDPTGGNDG